MSGLNALQVRDLVGFAIIVARSMVVRSEDLNAIETVRYAFEVADQFVDASEGQWAIGARENHREKKSKKKINGGGAVGK